MAPRYEAPSAFTGSVLGVRGPACGPILATGLEGADEGRARVEEAVVWRCRSAVSSGAVDNLFCKVTK